MKLWKKNFFFNTCMPTIQITKKTCALNHKLKLRVLQHTFSIAVISYRKRKKKRFQIRTIPLEIKLQAVMSAKKHLDAFFISPSYVRNQKPRWQLARLEQISRGRRESRPLCLIMPFDWIKSNASPRQGHWLHLGAGRRGSRADSLVATDGLIDCEIRKWLHLCA